MAPSADSASLHLVSDADVDTTERRAISSWSGIAQGPKSEMHVTGTVAILKIFPFWRRSSCKGKQGLKIFCGHCFKKGKGENVGSIFRPLRMGSRKVEGSIETLREVWRQKQQIRRLLQKGKRMAGKES